MQHKPNSNIITSTNISSSTNNNIRHPTVVSRKVALLGYRAVGKSCLTNSFLTGAFSPTYDPTIESTYHKTIRFRKVHFTTDIVDTAGMVCSEWIDDRAITPPCSIQQSDAFTVELFRAICSRLVFFIVFYCIGRIFKTVPQRIIGCTWIYFSI